jgi:predicted DCC family thiol-disulfide oxidoreductase YuxK
VNDDVEPVLLYDGLCGFCDRTVRLLLRADRRQIFRFAPLDGDFARAVVARHPHLQNIDSLVLVEPADGGAPERVYVRSEGFIRSVKRLGGAWRLLTVFALVPRPIRDWAYDAFASHRYRVFGRLEACPVPEPEVRGRFLA